MMRVIGVIWKIQVLCITFGLSLYSTHLQILQLILDVHANMANMDMPYRRYNFNHISKAALYLIYLAYNYEFCGH